MTHSFLDILSEAVIRYGYWAVGAALLLENSGIPIPGEPILLLASFLAYSQHQLQLSWIIVIAIIAATLGNNLGYMLGYYSGRPLLERYQNVLRIPSATLLRGERLFARYGPATVFFARFIFGVRIIAGPLAGVLRMPWRRFLLFNFVGAVLWATVIASVGYFFGRHWERLENSVRRFNLIVAICVVLLIVVVWWRNRHAAPSE